MIMTFQDIVHYRRSIRKYKELPIDPEIGYGIVWSLPCWLPPVPICSSGSSTTYYRPGSAQKDSPTPVWTRPAASTAPQMVVFVTRQDLFRKRARAVKQLQVDNVRRNSPLEKQAKRIKRFESYYGFVMPFLYGRFFGLLGLFRRVVSNAIGLFRPITYFVSEADMRAVVHKTCALAAQTFMLAMSSEGYDTCAMEGVDGRMVKRILKLPRGAEINMIVSCGIRDEEGVWGDRTRIPFGEVYFRI
jgi:nitroreductase